MSSGKVHARDALHGGLVVPRGAQAVAVQARMRDVLETSLSIDCCLVPVGEPDRFIPIWTRQARLPLYSFFMLKGHLEARRRYHVQHFERAATSMRPVVGEQFGFLDFFVPVLSDRRCVAFLVAGAAAPGPLSEDALLRSWRKLAASAPEPFDMEFAEFGRAALTLPIFVPAVRTEVATALSVIARIIAEPSADDRDFAELGRVEAHLARAHPGFVSSLASDLVEPYIYPFFGPRMRPREQRVLGPMRTPNAVAAFVPRPRRGDSSLCARAHGRLVQHCLGELRASMPELVTGRLELLGGVALFHASAGRRPGERMRKAQRKARQLAAAVTRATGLELTVSVAVSAPEGPSLPQAYERAVASLRWAEEPPTANRRASSSRWVYAVADRLEGSFARGDRAELDLATSAFIDAAFIDAAGRADGVRTHFGHGLERVLGVVEERGLLAPRQFDELRALCHHRLDAAQQTESLRTAFEHGVVELLALGDRPSAGDHAAAVARALRFIDGALSGPVTLTGIARDLHLSPWYLSRVFRRVRGRTFREELRVRRLKRAEDMLLSTNMTVRQICHAAGFTTYNAFFATFRRVHRVTPCAFREQRRALNRTAGRAS